ncbi:ABC transporter ATP-binding protein [Shewanella sp. 4t3-1-2LB]|jgi:cobalt/nickel transport system ATP-binding protein|nr:ABC transporter ATP-binding protein [Shewanella sp. 4t3-1-2LB]MBO1272680.1 ABC transporter ATP-binding protein [Shewanella sp. 4t3-1-2LB]
MVSENIKQRDDRVTETSHSALLKVAGLGFAYAQKPVFSEVNFELYPGDRLALIGANGAGKSTLLRVLVGLAKPNSGSITAFGQHCVGEESFQRVRQRMGLLFQDSDDQLFCPTVLEDVAFGPLNQGLTAEQAIAKAQTTLASLGMAQFAERITYRLSGGEKRMVALATVLAMSPEILLLDEPTNGLDAAAEERLLQHLQALPQAMIIVSHDRAVLERLANRAVILQSGQLDTAVMHRHPHQHAHEHLHVHPSSEVEAGKHGAKEHH